MIKENQLVINTKNDKIYKVLELGVNVATIWDYQDDTEKKAFTKHLTPYNKEINDKEEI